MKWDGKLMPFLKFLQNAPSYLPSVTWRHPGLDLSEEFGHDIAVPTPS
jgi:hypothetical protein